MTWKAMKDRMEELRFPDDGEVRISSDAEGNETNPLVGVSTIRGVEGALDAVLWPTHENCP